MIQFLSQTRGGNLPLISFPGATAGFAAPVLPTPLCFVQQGKGNEMPGSDFNLGNIEAQLSCIMCAKAMPAVTQFNTYIYVWRSFGMLI